MNDAKALKEYLISRYQRAAESAIECMKTAQDVYQLMYFQGEADGANGALLIAGENVLQNHKRHLEIQKVSTERRKTLESRG